jgi:hypothetical protein
MVAVDRANTLHGSPQEWAANAMMYWDDRACIEKVVLVVAAAT